MESVAECLENAAADMLLIGLNWPEAARGFDVGCDRSARRERPAVGGLASATGLEVWAKRARRISAALERHQARRTRRDASDGFAGASVAAGFAARSGGQVVRRGGRCHAMSTSRSRRRVRPAISGPARRPRPPATTRWRSGAIGCGGARGGDWPPPRRMTAPTRSPRPARASWRWYPPHAPRATRSPTTAR